MYQNVPSNNGDNSHFPINSPYQPTKRKPLPQANSLKPSTSKTYDDAQVLGVYQEAGTSTRLDSDDTLQQSLLAHKSVRASPYLARSSWSKHNVFTKSGRELLRRKFLSSGPANWTRNVPGDDEEDDVSNGHSGPVKRRAGWRKGTIACCFAVTFCIVIELVLLIWALSTSIGGPGTGLLYTGNCEKVKDMAVWLLLPLNIAATVLISTSNYVMQIMTAPSRSEIDRAHQSAEAVVVCGMSSQFLRIGGAGTLRRTIWWLLVLSSVPIHLFLNSAIYSSVQASNTGVLVVSDGFDKDATWDQCNSSSTLSSSSFSFACSLMKSYRNGDLRQLSREQCILQYAHGFQTNASSVLVVAAAGSGRWYSPPPAQTVPPYFSKACRWDDVTSTYHQIPDHERYFKFDYAPQIGTINVSLPFYTCRNETHTNSSTGNVTLVLKPFKDAGLMPIYSSTEGLFFPATNFSTDVSFNDPLLNITSVRSVFDAVNYRFWATAQHNGDYLSPYYKALSQGWETRFWLCSGDDLMNGIQCDTSKLAAKSEWKITPSEMSVIGCHVYHKDEQCTLRYSWRILIATICCDIIKLLAMMEALMSISNHHITIGDVIESFLQEPDPYTKRRCLLDNKAARKWTTLWASKKHVWRLHLRCIRTGKPERRLKSRVWQSHNIPYGHLELSQFDKEAEHWLATGGLWWLTTEPVVESKEWVSQSRRWFAASSSARWCAFVVLCSSSVFGAIAYLVLGLKSLHGKRLSSMWTAGISGPDPNALWEGGLMSSAESITGAAILVNLPQLLFSMLYFVFNALLTSMHTAHEWANFTKYRKALRVSSPRGQQRSTYWLQLPWAYSIPLIVASGCLHWLLGRSIYLVKVETYGYFGQHQAARDFFACGYSPIATVALIVLLGCMELALFALALRRLGSDSPLVLCNSLAIAAACHPDPSEKDVALKPLMWGVVKDENGLDTQHCSFSAREVSPLQEGHYYS